MAINWPDLANSDPGHSVRGEVLPVKKYELIFILKADQPETEMEARVNRVKEILADHSGEITQVNHWGVRRMAYEIQYESRGNYMFLKFKSEGTVVAELDRFLRLDDQVLRHLVVVDDEWDERNRVSMAKRRQNRTEENAGAAE
jgi:small subunit ribosomal protein S6